MNTEQELSGLEHVDTKGLERVLAEIDATLEARFRALESRCAAAEARLAALEGTR